jgi:hypothetical protein
MPHRTCLALLASVLLAACSGGDPEALDEIVSVAGDVTRQPSEPDMEAMLADNQAAIDEHVSRSRAESTEEEARALLAELGSVPQTYEEMVAEDQRLRSGALSAGEERTLRAMFSSTGAEELVLEGRVVQWGDLVFYADELLAEAAAQSAVDKAQICTTAQTTGSCVGNGGTPFAKIDADGDFNTLPFRRPDVVTTTFMIVANATPSFVFNALLVETSKIENLNPPGDCLGSASFVVIRQSAFDGLSATAKAHAYKVAVQYTAGACSGALACAGLPGLKTLVLANGSSVSRVALGKATFSMNSTRLTSDDNVFRTTLLHELGHMMGRSHPENDGSAGLIPGTSTQLLVKSVMCAPDASCASTDLSADDILAIETLYSDSPNRSNDGCTYDPNFRTFTAL